MLANIDITVAQIQQDILGAENYQQIKPSEHKELLLKLIDLPDETLSKQCVVVFLSALNSILDLPEVGNAFFYNVFTSIEPQQLESIYATILKAKRELGSQRQPAVSSAKAASMQLMIPASVIKALKSIERIKEKATSIYNENDSYLYGYQRDIFNTNSPLVIALLFESYMAEQRRVFPKKDLYLLEPFIMQLENLRRGSECNMLFNFEDFETITNIFTEQASEILKSPQSPAKEPSKTGTPLNSQRQAVRQNLDTLLGKPQVTKTEHARSRSVTVKGASRTGESTTIKTLIKDKAQLLEVVQGLTKSLSLAYSKADSAFGYKEVLQKIYDLCHSEILTQEVKGQLENNLAKLVYQFCALYISAIAATETQETSLLDSVLKQLKIFINFYKENYKNTDMLHVYCENQIEFLRTSKNKIINSNFAEFSEALLNQIQADKFVDDKLLDGILFKESFSSGAKSQKHFINKIERNLQQSLPAKEQAAVTSNTPVNPKRESLSSKERLATQADSNSKPRLPARNATPQFLSTLENSLQQASVKEQKPVKSNVPVSPKQESMSSKESSITSYLQSWWSGDEKPAAPTSNNSTAEQTSKQSLGNVNLIAEMQKKQGLDSKSKSAPTTTQPAKELSQTEPKTSTKQGLANAGLLAEMRKRQGSVSTGESKDTDNTHSATPQLR